MLRSHSRIRMLAVPLLLVPAPAAAQSRPTEVNQASFAACFEAQARSAEFSGVASAVRGSTSLFAAKGVADPDGKIPLSRDTRFRLASVQKVLTQVAIGLLADQGRLGLDDPIGTHLKGLPPAFAAITIDQLLRHRSGVAPFTNLAKMTPETRMAYGRAATGAERLAVVAALPLSFAPGQGNEYSNGGYQVLGAVIEAVSGKPYGTFLEEAIYRPLGMTATNLLPDSGTAVRLTKMRIGGGTFDQWTAAVARTERPGHPAGDGVSTIGDLTKLGTALLGDTLLSPAVKARVFPRKGDTWRIGQSGGTMGTNTDFAVYPDSGWVVTVLANYDPPAGELMGEVLREFARGNGCKPLSATDRVSPMQRLNVPPNSSS